LRRRRKKITTRRGEKKNELRKRQPEKGEKNDLRGG